MLNVGVATWWLLRPGPLPAASWVQPDGVPALRLLGEADKAHPAPAASGEATSAEDAMSPVAADATSATATPGAASSATTPVDGPATEAAASAVADNPGPSTQAPVLRCMSFGPYADASLVAAARNALRPFGAARMRVRDVVDAPRGWRVAVAPQADRAAADALAARIRDAGFDDLLVIPSGDEANGIALGRYGGEAAARRRESGLRAAGFPAQAQPLGDASTRHWLDLAAGPDFDAAAARSAAGAAEARGIDCAGVVAVTAR